MIFKFQFITIIHNYGNDSKEQIINFSFCIQVKTYISKLHLHFQRTYNFISLAFERYLSVRKANTYRYTVTIRRIIFTDVKVIIRKMHSEVAFRRCGIKNVKPEP